jgi:hypothetical protein
MSRRSGFGSANADSRPAAARRARRKDVVAAQSAPDPRELGDALGSGSAGEERGVERADGGADEQVGDDVAVRKSEQHPDLNRAEAAAAGQHGRGDHEAGPP